MSTDMSVSAAEERIAATTTPSSLTSSLPASLPSLSTTGLAPSFIHLPYEKNVSPELFETYLDYLKYEPESHQMALQQLSISKLCVGLLLKQQEDLLAREEAVRKQYQQQKQRSSVAKRYRTPQDTLKILPHITQTHSETQSSSSSSSSSSGYGSIAETPASISMTYPHNAQDQNNGLNTPFLYRLPPKDRSTTSANEYEDDEANEDDEDASARSTHKEMTVEEYFAFPMWKLLLKRLPWLVVLLLLQSFGALILNHYNELIAKHLVLNFFIPTILSCAGNAGNQPGVMVTRALALGRLKLWQLLLKEGPVAIITGGILGAVVYFRVKLVYPEDPLSSWAIAISLFLAIVVAVTLSILFSYILHHITCCDPADGAVPLLSTVSDIIGILIVVGIAHKLLPNPREQ